MRIRLSARLATRLQPAAHVKDSCRSDALKAPMNALLTKPIARARARIRSAGSDCGYKNTVVGGWARTNNPTAMGQPMTSRALKNRLTASVSSWGRSRKYTDRTGNTTDRSVIGMKRSASNGLYAAAYHPASACGRIALDNGWAGL